jgi:hypothetical protein
MTTHPQELLARSPDDDLSYLEHAALRDHLARCTDCAALASDLRRGEELLTHAEARPPIPSFDDIANRSAGLGWLAAAGAVAAAFVVLAALVVGVSTDGARVGAAPVVATVSPMPASPTPVMSYAPSPSPTPVVSAPPVSPSPTAVECSRPAIGDITLCPAVVSAGAPLSITIPPRGCANSGEATILYFGTAEQFGESTAATYGEIELGGFGPSSGISVVTLAVPVRLGALDGRGGGPPHPGLYAVYAKAVGCHTFVTVQ